MTEPRARWSPATRIAFRFAFAYFFLGFVPMILNWLPFSDLLLEKYNDFWDAVVVWFYDDVLRLPHEIDFPGLGVTNSTYGSILFLGYLAVAVAATAIWSILDKKRESYERLHAWLRFLLRYSLAFLMILYGTMKVIPAQMTAPPPLRVLLARTGDLPPNSLLWWTVGASPPFETFTGLAELLGGVLLLLPRTTLLGALISAGNMLLVFLLNMCYDVPVKLPSLHMLVKALILIAPDMRRIANVLLFNRRAEPSRIPPLFKNKWINLIPHAYLLVMGLYAVHGGFNRASTQYELFHPPRPPLYGAWTVESFARDGREVPPFAEPDRWRLVLIEKPGALSVEMAGSMKSYQLELDTARKTMKLSPIQATFSFAQPEKDVIVLDGRLEGRRVRAKLRKMPLIRRTT
ncbi:MAG TPA: hypothetical protein VF179_24515 [Thermoanaerobaculia bacterium]|nr:hypothetical protein [Thermoanaerobaculia bacterium]